MIIDAIHRPIFHFSLLFSHYFDLNVCARKHLSCVIHLHFELLYILERNRARKSNQANSYSISIHMSFLLSQHLARLFVYCCLLPFFVWCDADISLWEVIIIRRRIAVGMSDWIPLSFDCHSILILYLFVSTDKCQSRSWFRKSLSFSFPW